MMPASALKRLLREAAAATGHLFELRGLSAPTAESRPIYAYMSAVAAWFSARRFLVGFKWTIAALALAHVVIAWTGVNKPFGNGRVDPGLESFFADPVHLFL